MYELILLDADGTIFDFIKAEKTSFEQSLAKFEIKGDWDEIFEDYKVINQTLWKGLEKGSVNKENLKTERFKQLCDLYGFDVDPVLFGETYIEFLSHSSFLIDGALSLCKKLHRKYKVYILTNGIKQVQDTRLAESELKDYIHGMIVSDEVGVSKPDPYIYEYSFKKAKHNNKKTALMIGDSLSADIAGGNNFGIDTCFVNLYNLADQEGIKPNYTFTSLKQLEEWL